MPTRAFITAVSPRSEAPVSFCTSEIVLGPASSMIKNAVVNRRFQNQRWNISPGKLHDAFRRYRSGNRCGHTFLTIWESRNYTCFRGRLLVAVRGGER